MTRRWSWVLGALGALAVLTALVVAIAVPPSPSRSLGPGGRLAVIVGLVVALYHLWRLVGGGDTSFAPPPWQPGGGIVLGRPEETPSDVPLSGETLSQRLEAAERAALRDRRVQDGLDVVRPLLRETLVAALERGEHSADEAETALAAGTWTDDGLAAATLDRRVEEPRRSLRDRVLAWLFPARVVRRRTRRAVQAIAEAADESLPAVVGQRAPRTVPVLTPALEDLQRGADGRLQRAVDPDSVRRGPDPARPDVDPDPSGPREDGTDGFEPSSNGAGGDVESPGSDRDGGNDSVETAGAESDGSDGDEDTASVGQTVTKRATRWQGGLAATVLLAVVGLVATEPTLVLAATIPLAYVAYGSATTTDLPDGVVARRRVEPTPASPGHPVEVTLTVHNGTDRTLSDVRLVDGVPEELAVMDGTPRAGTTLDPGERCTIEYVVVARRGEYDFEPPRLRLRDASAGSVTTTSLPVAGEERLVCRLDADIPPLEEEGDKFAGQLTSDDPGRGVEFHSTREYRSDDPADRIDWRHYAKRGTLATVNYRRRVAATVVLVVDARRACRVVSGPGRPTAVELESYAATRAMTDLLREGHDVGVAVVGLDGPGPAGLHWLPPGGGSEQRSRALALFERAIESDTVATSPSEQSRKLLEIAPPGAQVALLTPMVDGWPVEAVEAWTAHDVPTVVLSPDVLSTNTVSGQLDQVRRRTWLARCQAAGAWTVDWQRGTPLPLALEYAFTAKERLASGRIAAGGGR